MGESMMDEIIIVCFMLSGVIVSELDLKKTSDLPWNDDTFSNYIFTNDNDQTSFFVNN